MKQSRSKILTTHTGSLPRSGSVADLLETRDSQGLVDPQVFESGADEAVTEVVNRQVAIGLDVINDGEQSKPSYATYVKDRFTGFRAKCPSRRGYGWMMLIFRNGRPITLAPPPPSSTGRLAMGPLPGAIGPPWNGTWTG